MKKILSPFKRNPPQPPEPPGPDPFGEFQSDAKRLAAVESRHARDVHVAQIQSRVMLAKVAAALVATLAIGATAVVVESAAATALAASAGGLLWRVVGRGY